MSQTTITQHPHILTKFDEELARVDHYVRYPSLIPFVGVKYEENPKRILILGESFYLSDECNQHKNAESWYNGNENVIKTKDRGWMNCRGLITYPWNDSSDEAPKTWKPRGHYMYREINRCLREAKYVDIDGNAFVNVAYMNTFQRPSPKAGDSIAKHCEPVDIEQAVKTISSVVSIIKPKTVIFASKYSWRTVGKLIADNYDTESGINFDFTYHPASGGRFWHSKRHKDGCEKFMALIRKE